MTNCAVQTTSNECQVCKKGSSKKDDICIAEVKLPNCKQVEDGKCVLCNNDYMIVDHWCYPKPDKNCIDTKVYASPNPASFFT